MNDLNTTNRTLTLQEAANLIGTSRSRVWRAMNDGHLSAEKRRISGRSVWTVDEDSLKAWARTFFDVAELEAMDEAMNKCEQSFEHDERSLVFADVREHSSLNEPERDERSRTQLNEHEPKAVNDAEQSSIVAKSPPFELYLEMLNRLQHAERRAVELEMQLRQSQRLLTENAESIIEREARAKEAEAKEAEAQKHLAEMEVLRQTEVARLATELDAVKTQHQVPIKRGFLSWLGLRRTRSQTQSDEKTA